MADPKDPKRLIYYPGNELAPRGELRDRYMAEKMLFDSQAAAEERLKTASDAELLDELYAMHEQKRRWKEQRLGPPKGQMPEGAHNFGFGRTLYESMKPSNVTNIFSDEIDEAETQASLEAAGDVAGYLGWGALALGLAGMLAPAAGAGAAGAGAGAAGAGAGAGTGAAGAGAGAAAAAGAFARAAGPAIARGGARALTAAAPAIARAGETLAQTASGLLALNGLNDMRQGKEGVGAAKVGLALAEMAVPMVPRGAVTRAGLSAAERAKAAVPYAGNVALQLVQDRLVALADTADKVSPGKGDSLRELAGDADRVRGLVDTAYENVYGAGKMSPPSPRTREFTRDTTGYNLGMPSPTTPVPSMVGMEDDPSLLAMPAPQRP